MTNATQIIILSVFIFFLIVAVIVFAALGTNSNTANSATVVIWGTIPESIIPHLADAINSSNPGAIKVQYRKIDEDKFEDTLTSALADGTGPDAVLMSSDFLYQNRKRIAIIGYSTYPQRTFKDTFAGASEILLNDQGAYGLPVALDPLVMYWNRDILSSSNIAIPPKTWEETLQMVPKLSQINDDKTIKRSAIALGDYTNVVHGKEIMNALMMQAGTSLINWSTGSSVMNDLDANGSMKADAPESALAFFSQFSDPEKNVYSWTRALPDSLTAFASGDVALYFGPASDEAKIRAKNPNLNFDLTALPQPATATLKKTYASVLSFSILTSSKNQQGALSAIEILTGSLGSKTISDSLGIPSARRDLLSATSVASDQSVFMQSALFAKGALDLDPNSTDAIYKSAVDSIVSGQVTPADASKNLSKSLDELIGS